jgi:hypothetical protein
MFDPVPQPWELTGGFTYVRGFLGRLILRVQEVRLIPHYDNIGKDAASTKWVEQKRWRQAQYRDLERLREIDGNAAALGAVMEKENHE